MNRLGMLVVVLAALGVPACAEDDAFADRPNGVKQHVASGFFCPQKIGHFDRDAVGQRDPQSGADYCAYSAQGGVYGTVVLMPMRGEFDPKGLMAPEFVEQEGTGGRMNGETTVFVGPAKTLPVYVRTYEAAKVEAIRYRTLFACAGVGNWAVEVIVEYGDPRDVEAKTAFFDAIYTSALAALAP
jgi:hypothetical protein